MQSDTFSAWFNALVNSAASKKERRLVVLSGSESWAKLLLEEVGFSDKEPNSDFALKPELTSSKSCWLIYSDSEKFRPNVQTKRYQDKLGSESDFIVFADSLFTIDALAALSGTLKAGGILFIISPLQEEQSKHSAFAKRFFTLVKDCPEHYIINQSDVNFPKITSTASSVSHSPIIKTALDDKQCVTQEQSRAVALIKKVLTGHRKRPFVLTADRGRGKSSALAIACTQLLLTNQKEPLSIIITAPERQSLVVFFQQLMTMLPEASLLGNKVSHLKGSVEFVAIDRLLAVKLTPSIVLVDEASGFPVYLLEQLLSQYHRMVFASTVHGYEGAGRGFTLKFQKTLSTQCPYSRSLHINEPIRWRENDPLEQLMFHGCLLNSELGVLESTHIKASTSNTFVEQVTVSELLRNEKLLTEVFSILVTAHYQTKPSDLKLLLDNSNVQLMCLFTTMTHNHTSSKSIDSKTENNNDNNEKQLIGVALLIQEGSWSNHTEITQQEVAAVASSKRRLSNHFLPQSLFVHCGIEDAFNYRYLRIMRVAVHPQLQQQGFGSVFIEKLNANAKLQNVDFIGTSFGVNPSLLSFWYKLGLSIARIGFTQDKASGEHSALLLNSFTEEGSKIQKRLIKSFYRSVDYLLLDEYKTLSTELVLLILLQQSSQQSLVKGLEQQSRLLSIEDLNTVQAFSTGQRVYSSCAYSLYLWFKNLLTSKPTNINTKQGLKKWITLNDLLSNQDTKMALVFTCRLLQKHTIDHICQYYGFTGKKMLNKAMMEYVQKHLDLS
jgi:tRNA(Met) cytidine acetyltransferase